MSMDKVLIGALISCPKRIKSPCEKQMTIQSQITLKNQSIFSGSVTVLAPHE